VKRGRATTGHPSARRLLLRTKCWGEKAFNGVGKTQNTLPSVSGSEDEDVLKSTVCAKANPIKSGLSSGGLGASTLACTFSTANGKSHWQTCRRVRLPSSLVHRESKFLGIGGDDRPESSLG